MEIRKKTATSHDGYNLYYETYNLETGKIPLFFLHGMGGDLDAWHFVRDALLAKGFSAIAMDLRGHGHSAHPRKHQSYNINHLAEDVHTIMRAENINKINLIGHCYGAMVATHFALNFQDKIENLVLISSTFRAPDYLQSKTLRKIAGQLSSLLAHVSPRPIKPGHSNYPIGKFHKDYEWFGLARTIMRNSWRSYLLSSKQIINLDLETELSKINLPTLVIAGEKDSIFPLPISKTIHSKIKDSKFAVVNGANHVVILNNHKEVTTILFDFLATQTVGL